MIRLLKPIYDRPKDYEPIEDAVLKTFRKLYLPLLESLKKPKSILNTRDDLAAAISQGHIRYQNNGFVGIFSSTVSRELKALGAVFSKRGGKWLIRSEMLPRDIQNVIYQSGQKDEELRQATLESLDQVSTSQIVQDFNGNPEFYQYLTGFDKAFRDSVKDLTIPPKLSRKAKQAIAEDYTENMRLYIRKWSEERITELRKMVESHVFEGNRRDSLAKKIKADYEVSERKARFLARQETNLLSSKLKEVRYADAGIDEYLWVSVTGTEDHPVRPLHKELNARSKKGETFRFSDPPKSGTKGEHQNPGEPFGCRCTAIPVVRF